ncbi:hypothetical protein [Streptomyces sp. TRM68367]|uniref:hypothetical protein n=1 Tax=Streptomyces sp. TRM68367 TaxID=2758415 RepID=UPI00165AF1D3|nr:hypothetical protein [Streptomyces sp. TRM68367]MBC9731027.1 hypothetical protein [Streptomyces sp. TRM68367]
MAQDSTDAGGRQAVSSDGIGQNRTGKPGAMPGLKRPQLSEGPKKELNGALHDLHLRAGHPSVRDLEHRIGVGIAGKSRIHDAFSKHRLPKWDLLSVLVPALAQTVPGVDLAVEEARIYQLWLAASGSETPEGPMNALLPENLTPPQTDEVSITPVDRNISVSARQLTNRRPVLAMRIEWFNPSGVDINTRRSLRAWVDSALDDIGWPSYGDHRRNHSAGVTIVLDDPDESPNLTIGTFLSALDAEVVHLRKTVSYYSLPPLNLAFLAALAASATGPEEAVRDLSTMWSDDLTHLWQRSGGAISAVVYGIDIRDGQLPGTWAGDYMRPGAEWAGLTMPCHVRIESHDPWAAAPF